MKNQIKKFTLIIFFFFVGFNFPLNILNAESIEEMKFLIIEKSLDPRDSTNHEKNLQNPPTGTYYIFLVENITQAVNLILGRLGMYNCIKEIHFRGHGSPGTQGVGDGVHTVADKHINSVPGLIWETQLNRLGGYFCSSGAKIFLWGCNVGAGPQGAAKLKKIADLLYVTVQGTVNTVYSGQQNNYTGPIQIATRWDPQPAPIEPTDQKAKKKTKETKYVDNFNGINDTNSLKVRGYKVYYRGTGPQGITATWYQGTPAIFPAFNGTSEGYVAANYNVVTNANNIDSWLVLPKNNITAGDSLFFYARSVNNPTYPDSLRVMYSAVGDSTPEAGSWIELGRFRTWYLTDEWERKGFRAPSSGSKARFAIRYAVVNGGPSGSNSNYIGIEALTIETPILPTTPDVISIPSQYPNLTSAFNAINNGTHGNGNITVKINGSFTQTSSATLNGGVFTSCTIEPTVNATVSGNFIGGTIILNGADNVTIDGRIGGTGTTNDLTFTNQYSAGVTITMQNGATNNVVRYCNMNLPLNGQNVNIAQSTPGTGGNNDNTIENCVLSGGQNSININGTGSASGYTNDRTTIRNNKVKNFRQQGILLGLETVDNNVTQNEIFNDAAVAPFDHSVNGILNLGVGTNNITKNYIHDINYTASNVIYIFGIASSPFLPTVPGAPTTSTVNVINNIIALGGNNTFTLHGISIASAGMLYTANIYYNSIRIFGNSNTSENQLSSGISQYTLAAGSIYNQFNNLVRNDRTGGSNSTHYGTYRAVFPGTINADYNTISATDPAKGVNARFGSVNYSSIKKYKDAIAKHNVNNNNFNLDNSELHSSFQPAPFISNTDLHINTSGVGGDMNAKPFPSIAADDFDNQMRSSTFPYRGADHIGFSLKLLNLTFALEAITNPPSSTADIIILQLINPATCAIVASSTATLPPVPGNTAIFAFGNLIPDGTLYYLRVIHRSSLSLWSATTQSFASGSLTYDFTNASNKAFGVNAMKLVGTEWSMVSGDVNWDAGGVTQDGFIDGSDFILIDNAAFTSTLGYVDSDLTGNNYVDGSDLALADNNRSLLEQAPCAFTSPEHINLKDEVKSKKINSINRPADENKK